MSAIVYNLKAYNHVCDANCIHDAKKSVNDPTKTLGLRKRYKSRMDTRWVQVRQALRALVVDQNVLRLKQTLRGRPVVLGVAPQEADANVLKSFQGWVDGALARIILENDAAYLMPMVEETYNKAVVRAETLLGKEAPQTRAKARAKIGALHQLTIMETQGIMEAVSQQIVRAATNGVLTSRRPRVVMRLISRIIQSTGVTRSRAMVNVMVVKTFSEGTLDAFAESGIKKVSPVPETIVRKNGVQFDGLIRDAPRRGPGSRLRRGQEPSASTLRRIRRAEKKKEATLERVNVLTAGDDDVCPVCEDISDNGPYTIDTARSLIPAHPSCRCAFVPADDERFASDE